MLTVMKGVPLQNEIIVRKRSRNKGGFFILWFQIEEGPPFFFYHERGSHPKMRLEWETQTWTSDSISPLWFQNGVWPTPPPVFISRGVTPHPEIIVRDNHLANESPGINHFHFLFLLKISAAGHWTKFVLVFSSLPPEPMNSWMPEKKQKIGGGP